MITTSIKSLSTLSKDLLNLFFPIRCVICQKDIDASSADPLCSECKGEIPVNDGASCKVCGEPIEGTLPLEGENLCGPCRIPPPPPFDRTVFSLHYRGKSRELIHQLKFRGKAGLAKTISNLLAARLNRELEMKEIDLVIPIPLHFLSLFHRGYNQSYLLAREIGSTFGIPVNTAVLVKTRKTATQSSLSKAKRVRNIRKAFNVKRPEAVKGKNILLVDDLMTTGATLREASRMLKRSGAKTVACAVAARA